MVRRNPNLATLSLSAVVGRINPVRHRPAIRYGAVGGIAFGVVLLLRSGSRGRDRLDGVRF